MASSPVRLVDENDDPIRDSNPLPVEIIGGAPGGGASTIADGADINSGSTTDAAVTTDALGTLSAKLRGLIVLFVNFLSRFPAALGANGGLKVEGVAGGVSQLVDTELPAAAALGDAGANPTAPAVAAYGMVFSGSSSNWSRQRSASDDGLGSTGMTAAPAYGFNATSWDRLRAGLVAVQTTFVGLLNTISMLRYNATPPTLADGNVAPLQGDVNGNLKTNVITFPRIDSINDSILSIPGSPTKTSYRIAISSLAPAAAATNIVQLIGSATKTVKITAIRISGIATAAGAYIFAIRKQSAADTVGTSSVPTIVPLDSANAAATAAAKQYSANPTLGTLVGLVAIRRATVTTAAGAIPNVPAEFKFGDSVAQELVLRGVAQAMAISLEGATMTGGALDIEIEFTEE